MDSHIFLELNGAGRVVGVDLLAQKGRGQSQTVLRKIFFLQMMSSDRVKERATWSKSTCY